MYREQAPNFDVEGGLQRIRSMQVDDIELCLSSGASGHGENCARSGGAQRASPEAAKILLLSD